jgi:lambda repressor-like predicted transcriptional regulator
MAYMPDNLASIAEEYRRWGAKRDALIRDAHRRGMSLRAIADAVQLSHSGVKRIVDRE